MIEYLSFFLLSIILIGLVIYIRSLKKIENENLILQNNITQAQQFYNEMQERVDGIRKYRHDLQKHIRIVEQFLKEGKQFEGYEEYQELQGYIKEMQEDIEGTKSRPYCQDELLNAICQIKAEECRDAGVPFKAEIHISEKVAEVIDPYHITGILMNFLDNALEAEKRCEQEVEKGISLNLREDGEGLFICVGNDLPENFDPSLKTSKADKEEHGMGLAIARDYAGKYSGKLEMNPDRENRYFEISTTLVKRPEEREEGMM
ncbi:MAG: GHKL domain-containing protein [Eubacterium sp.]|nr:GHKL domain-containing protein [Eubacterium sp.]